MGRLIALLSLRQGLASEDAVVRFEAFVLRVHDIASQQLVKEDELLADAPDDFLGKEEEERSKETRRDEMRREEKRREEKRREETRREETRREEKRRDLQLLFS